MLALSGYKSMSRLVLNREDTRNFADFRSIAGVLLHMATFVADLAVELQAIPCVRTSYSQHRTVRTKPQATPARVSVSHSNCGG